MDSIKISSFIEKFSGSNFPTWQMKLRLLLMREGIWNITNGKEPKPKSDDARISWWENQNDKAMAIIGLALADNLIHHVDFDRTANDVWEKLENLFGNKINNSKVFLKQKLFKLKMKETETLNEHLSNLGSILQQLSAIRAIVEDDDQVAVLLSSIEDISKYSEILAVLRVSRNMSFEDMVAHLIDEDRRLTEKAESSFEPDKAFFLKNKPKKKGKPLKCNYCQKLGHTEDRCFKKMAKVQAKEHANLVAEQSEDEDDEATPSGPEEQACTVAVSGLSLHEVIDEEWAF